MKNATKVSELFVHLGNKVGALAGVLQTLAKARVNVHGFFAAASGKTGTIQLLAADPGKASRVLKRAGYKVDRKPAVQVLYRDRVGAGAKLTAALAEAGINIDYAYASSGKAGRFGTILKTNNDAKAIKVLNALK